MRLVSFYFPVADIARLRWSSGQKGGKTEINHGWCQKQACQFQLYLLSVFLLSLAIYSLIQTVISTYQFP
jgi:hypothetical protein